MLSIIVLSSDGYSDCWDPFFDLLRINFPDVEKWELILSSNHKDYDRSDLRIKTLQHGDIPWSKRLKLSLKEAKNRITLVVVEDFFLLSKVDYEVFYKLLDLISTNKEIDHIRLLYNKEKVQTETSEYQYLDKIKSRSKYRFLFLPGLWDKEVLLKYVVDFETPFMAEKMGDYKSWVTNDGFFAVSRSYIENNGEIFDCGTSGAIIKGKWESWIVDRLEAYNIHIDYNIRGFKTQQTQKISKNTIRKSMLKNPILTVRSFLNVIPLVIKK